MMNKKEQYEAPVAEIIDLNKLIEDSDGFDINDIVAFAPTEVSGY